MDTRSRYIQRRSERMRARIPVTLLIAAKGAQVMHEAFIVDFSRLGARVKGRNYTLPLLPAQEVIIIPSEGPGYSLPSRVVWIGSTGSGHEGEAGLEFLESPLAPV
jgi:hypothetical protein